MESKSNFVYQGLLNIITDTFPDVMVKKEFSSLHLGRYLLSEIHGNRCLTRGSDGNVLFITTTGHQVGNSPGNHTILESCYDSLNSVKIFMSNLNSLNC